MSQQKPKWPTCDYPEHVAFVRARVPGSSFTCPKCLRTPEWIDCRDSDDPATTIASLRAENERLKETSDICPVCGPDAKGCSHIQPRRLLLAEIDRLRTLLAAAQAECEELNKLALVAETALAEFDELVRDNTISEADYAHVIPPLRSGVEAARRKVQG
jgi:hypothetical protein